MNKNINFQCRIRVLFFSNIFFIFFISQNLEAQNKLENLGKQINSSYNEQNPVLSPDGKTLYFTRERHPGNAGGKKDVGDIWFSTLDEEGNWTEAINIGKPLNDHQRNAIIGFSPDGNLLYLHNHYKNKTRGVSVSTNSNGGWSFPEKVDIPYFYNKSDHQGISLSLNGKIMMLSLESYSSFGNEDIYVSFLENGRQWTEPVNLGNTINTRFQEMTPFLDSDNTTLYFASNGHGGLGSRDIYMSKRLDDSWKNWSVPKNLSRPVNSEGVELSYFISPTGKYAYFSTTQNSDGLGDINRIPVDQKDRPEPEQQIVAENEVARDFQEPDTIIVIPQYDPVSTTLEGVPDDIKTGEKKVLFKGKVLGKNDNKPLEATIEIHNDDKQIKTISTDPKDGSYHVELTPGHVYKVSISAEGYLNDEKELALDDASGPPIERTYYLNSLEVGATIQLNNVFFERGTANMLKGSGSELDRVAQMLKENPDMEIEISGHTDNRGDAMLNIKLSKERVDTVMNYLVERGISRNRLRGKGYGGTKPIASNNSEETRRLNRRVEFTILQNGKD